MQDNSRMIIQIVVCDDNRTDRLQMAELTEKIMKERGIACAVSS